MKTLRTLTVKGHRMPDRKAREAGFSLIEALVASAVILIIMLGVMPLFTLSIKQNVAGKDSTVSTNYSRSKVEELISLPLDRVALRPTVGADSRDDCQIYEPETGWESVTCPDPIDDPIDGGSWARTNRVLQYNINEIYDGDSAAGIPTFKNPIQGYDISNDRFDSFVHIRELMVITQGQRAPNSPLGPGRRVDVVDLRGF